jgi:steroid delta-isomerase-like uncharacterized protein
MKGVNLMSTRNKAVVRGYFEEVWNGRRIDLLEQFMAEDVVPHVGPGITNRDEVKAFITTSLQTFPNFHIAIEDEIAEGDRVVHRNTISGTMQGELLGMPATGKHAAYSGVWIFRVADGKIAEFWGLADVPSMMQQLGLAPAPGG